MKTGSSGTMFNWLRDGLIPGSSAVLESLWAYAWMSFLLAVGEGASAQRYPYPWIVALIAAPALFARWLDRSSWGPGWLRQYGLTALVIGLFTGFMLPYHALGTGFLAAVVLLTRGIWLGLGEITSESAAGWFLAGLGAFLALLGVLLVAHPMTYDADRQVLGPMLAAYLFAGLCWLAVVRRQDMEEEAFRRPASGLNGTWLVLLSGISAALLGVVTLLSFGGGGLLTGLLRLIAAVVAGIWAAATWIVESWLGPALVWLFAHLPALPLRPRTGGGLFGRRPPPTDLDARLLAWLQVHLPIQVLLVLVFLMMAVLLAAWLAYRYRAWRSRADDEERTSLWSWALLWQQLRDALRGMRRALASRTPSRRNAHAAFPWTDVSSIRQLYALALRWCRQRQRPRRPAETPMEFEPVLDELVGPPLARDLTSAYLIARYGERDPGDSEVARLRRRWEERLDPG